MNIFGGLILKNRNLFAQTPAIPTPKGPFIILSEVDSTNNYAMAKLHAGLLTHGTSLLALHQSAGKGQRGKQWFTKPGENITMSTVFSLPHLLSPPILTQVQSYPFTLSAAVALGCYDFIKAFSVPDISIKWPNDLYIGDRKAGGVLIENIYRSGDWLWTIIGIGINLNQYDFAVLDNRAISVANITGVSYNQAKSGRMLQHFLRSRFDSLSTTPHTDIIAEYNSNLYKRGEQVKLRKSNAVFTTTISEVTIDGNLLTSDTIQRSFAWGEVEFVSG